MLLYSSNGSGLADLRRTEAIFEPRNLARWVIPRYLALEFAFRRGTMEPFTYTDLFDVLAPTGITRATSAEAQAEELSSAGLVTYDANDRPRQYAITEGGKRVYQQVRAVIAPELTMSAAELLAQLESRIQTADEPRDLVTDLTVQLRDLLARLQG